MTKTMILEDNDGFLEDKNTSLKSTKMRQVRCYYYYYKTKKTSKFKTYALQAN